MENQPGSGSTSPFGNEKGDVAQVSSGGRDFTKESRPQQNGTSECNPQSVPAGGKLPYSGEPVPYQSGGKPFKLNGEGAPAVVETDETEY